MKLNRLLIKNFKGIKDLELNPAGRNLTIRGENGTGKTTVADAYAWAVTGKGIDGSTIESQIKLRDEKGHCPNDGGKQHFVEVELKDDGGNDIIIRKVYTEKWQKKRGEAESEFTGHTTQYFFNDVPMGEAAFSKKMNEFCSEDVFRLLSMPMAFCSMKWQDRRKILVEIIGDIKDADVIAGNPDLEPMAGLLRGKTVEDLRKMLKQRLSNINDSIKTIPARIDELTNMVSSDEPEDRASVESEIKDLERQKKDLEQELLNIENGGMAAKIRTEIAEHQARLAERKSELTGDSLEKKSALEASALECRRRIEAAKGLSVTLGETVSRLETINKTTEQQMAALRDEWSKENEKAFDEKVPDTCPYCGQKLPDGKVEEAHRKAMEDFNAKKSEILKSINDKGKRMKEQVAKNLESMKESSDKLAEQNQEVDEGQKELASIEKKLKELAAPAADQDEEYKSILQSIAECQGKLQDAEDAGMQEVGKIRLKIEAVSADISLRNKKLSTIEQNEKAASRIDELKDEEKRLGKQYSETQQQMYLTKQFIRAKVDMVEDSINSHFKHVRFKMFEQQVNGGLKDCCEPLIDGVPYGDGLNKGNRMVAALDILNTLSKHYGKSLPVIIDDCESYTSLIPVDGQLIRLIADKDCKELEVEVG